MMSISADKKSTAPAFAPSGRPSGPTTAHNHRNIYATGSGACVATCIHERAQATTRGRRPAVRNLSCFCFRRPVSRQSEIEAAVECRTVLPLRLPIIRSGAASLCDFQQWVRAAPSIAATGDPQGRPSETTFSETPSVRVSSLSPHSERHRRISRRPRYVCRNMVVKIRSSSV